ncbi:SCO3374 family protein [Streptomyces sp. NPDC013433]|uniref:SCO3374 family protein n=1 Tax=Streptomyces sp. NPDC013433 TaxID=3155604 RepID=UPI0034544D0D
MVRSVAPAVPFPHRSLAPSDDEVRLWYENALGWPTVPGVPVRLAVGVRFDVLDVPAEAGRAALERLERSGGLGRGFPVALRDDRMRLLVAAGSAEELPGLLEWLDWGALELDLVAIGAGGLMDAPWPPDAGVSVGAGGDAGTGAGAGACAGGDAGPTTRPLSLGHGGSQGAAVWLRPPEPGHEAEASLPTLSAMGTRSGARGDGDGPPDLVRLVDTVATQIHRVRLRRADAVAAVRADGQPLAFS